MLPRPTSPSVMVDSRRTGRAAGRGSSPAPSGRRAPGAPWGSRRIAARIKVRAWSATPSMKVSGTLATDALASGCLDVDVVVPDGRPQHEARARRLSERVGVERQAGRDHDSAAAVSRTCPRRRVSRPRRSRGRRSRTARVSGQTTDPGAPTHTTRGPPPAPSPPREIGLHVLRASSGRPFRPKAGSDSAPDGPRRRGQLGRASLRHRGRTKGQRVESAAGRPTPDARDLARELDVQPALIGVRARHRGQEPVRVGMRRSGEDGPVGALLDDAAEIHHRELPPTCRTMARLWVMMT